MDYRDHIENIINSSTLSREEQIKALFELYSEGNKEPEELTRIELGYGMSVIKDQYNKWQLLAIGTGAARRTVTIGDWMNEFVEKEILNPNNGKLPEQKELWIAVDDSAVSNLTLSDMPPGRINEDGAYVDYPDNCNYAIICDYILPSTEPGKIYRCRLEEVELDDE